MISSESGLLSSVQQHVDQLKSEHIDKKLLAIQSLNALRQDSSSRKSFLKYCYENVLENLIALYEPTENNTKFLKQLDAMFLDEDSPGCWLMLLRHFQNTQPSFKLDKIICLIKQYIENDRLRYMFVECTCQEEITQKDVVNSVAKFPDVAANKLKKNNRDIFGAQQFFSKVSNGIYHALEHLYTRLSSNQNASTIFIANLISKLGLSGGLDEAFGSLIGKLNSAMKDDFIWRRIIEQLLRNVPDRCIEPVIIVVLNRVLWFEQMHMYLGNTILTNSKLQYIFTKKCLFFTQFNKDSVLYNIIGYLSLIQSDHLLFLKTFLSVLEVWGDQSAIKHRSFSHTFYLTKALFVFIAFIKKYSMNIFSFKSSVMKAMMHGTQSYIESPQHDLRQIGMLTSKYLSQTIDPNGPQLEFETPESDQSRTLIGLLEITERTEDIDCEPEVAPVQHKLKSLSIDNDNSSSIANLDSDDDEFEPYEIPQETRKNRIDKPKYVTDCMMGLVDTKRPEWMEKCLECMEDLIMAQPDNIHEVAQDVAKILLHLDDNLGVPKWCLMRRNCMVAITVVSPAQAASYFTTQFYDRNYSVRQRLDILETLAAAANKLSNDAIENQASSAKSIDSHSNTPTSHWHKLIDERLKQKTRIISKGKSKSRETTAVQNKFFPVAPLFFFPLINYVDKNNGVLNLFRDDDSFLLARLIYTLGFILNAAANSMACNEMAVSLMDLIWMLRYHTERFVRLALMFAFSMVVISVPSHLLVQQHQNELFECRQWLTDIIEQDPDEECQKLAKQSLSVLIDTVNKVFK